jgi:hypothetical protein
MNLLLATNAIFFLSATVFCWIFAGRINYEKGRRIIWTLLLLSAFYLASSVLNIMWALNLAEPSRIEILLAGSAFITPLSLILSYFFCLITGDKRILFFVILLSIAAAGISVIPNSSFLLILTMASFLLVMLVGIVLTLEKGIASRVAVLISVYGLLGGTTALVSVIGRPFGNLWFVHMIPLCLAILFLTRHSSEVKELKEEERKKNFVNESIGIKFAHYLFFMAAILTFLFVSTIAVHEIGHGVFGLMLNCSAESVIFSSDVKEHFFTRMSCPDYKAYTLAALGGVMLPILLSVMLLLSEGVLVKNIGLAGLAISIYIANSDLSSIGIPISWIVLLNILAILFVGKAFLQLAEYYCAEEIPEKSGKRGQKI